MATTAKTATPKSKAPRRAKPAPRDSHARDSRGRFKTDHHIRNTAFAATAAVGVAAVGLAAAFRFGLLDRFLPILDGLESSDDYLITSDDVDWHDDGSAPIHRAPPESMRAESLIEAGEA